MKRVARNNDQLEESVYRLFVFKCDIFLTVVCHGIGLYVGNPALFKSWLI